MKNRRHIILYLIIVALLASCTENNITKEGYCTNPLIDSVATVTCVAVIDGDTWKFQLQNDIFSVRILGIDCFETKHNERLRNQAEKKGITEDSAYSLGIIARNLAESLLLNKQVRIVRDFDEDNFDVYNRLLRKCYIDNLNYSEYIINAGLSAGE